MHSKVRLHRDAVGAHAPFHGGEAVQCLVILLMLLVILHSQLRLAGDDVGIGAAMKIGWGTGFNHIAVTGQGVGLRSFVDIALKGSFSATGGFEYNYTAPFTEYQQLRQIQECTKSGLIGISKTVSTKSRLLKQTKLSLLWDFLSYQNVPQTEPLIFRVGYNF